MAPAEPNLSLAYFSLLQVLASFLQQQIQRKTGIVSKMDQLVWLVVSLWNQEGAKGIVIIEASLAQKIQIQGSSEKRSLLAVGNYKSISHELVQGCSPWHSIVHESSFQGVVQAVANHGAWQSVVAEHICQASICRGMADLHDSQRCRKGEDDKEGHQSWVLFWKTYSQDQYPSNKSPILHYWNLEQTWFWAVGQKSKGKTYQVPGQHTYQSHPQLGGSNAELPPLRR